MASVTHSPTCTISHSIFGLIKKFKTTLFSALLVTHVDGRCLMILITLERYNKSSHVTSSKEVIKMKRFDRKSQWMSTVRIPERCLSLSKDQDEAGIWSIRLHCLPSQYQPRCIRTKKRFSFRCGTKYSNYQLVSLLKITYQLTKVNS